MFNINTTEGKDFLRDSRQKTAAGKAKCLSPWGLQLENISLKRYKLDAS
jgi:hypothetical protein